MTTPGERYRRSYRFGALERRGLAGGLRPGQVVVLGAACLFGVAVFRRMPNASGLAMAGLAITAALLASWWPLAGRTFDQWAPVGITWALSRVLGRSSYRSAAPQHGFAFASRGVCAPAVPLPPPSERTELLSVPLHGGGDIGVLADRRLGTYIAVALITVRSFGLLAAAEQERRLERWGRALASLARDGGSIRRVQLMERTLPHDEDQLALWRDAMADPAVSEQSPARSSYDALLGSAADVTQDHEVLVALEVDPSRRRRLSTGRDQDGVQLALREMRTLADRLEACEAGVAGLLSAERCAWTIRLAYEPQARRALRAFRGAAPSQLGPTASEDLWDRYRADGAVHRSYWVAQWPRLDVGPAFLAPLLLTSSAVRSFSIVVEPVPPARSRSAVEAAVTSDEADEEIRQQRGFRTTARRRKQQAATRHREAELAEGHEELRFAAFVTVSASDDEALDRSCTEIEQAAQQAYLELQPMWGEQAAGFVFGALPLCQGLARGRLLDR